jgi:hypothetical protein
MPGEKNRTTALMRYAGLATQWLAMLGIAVWAGLKLDERLHFKALFIIILPLAALIISLWQLIRSLNKHEL